MIDGIDDLKKLMKLKYFKGHAGRPGKVGGSMKKGHVPIRAPLPPIMLAGLSQGRDPVFSNPKQTEVIKYAESKFGSNWQQTHRIKKQPGGDYHLLERIGKRLPGPIVPITKRPDKAAKPIKPVKAAAALLVYGKSDWAGIPTQQLYDAAPDDVKKMADKTGLLAWDDTAYDYIKEKLAAHAKGLVDVSTLNSVGSYGSPFYNKDAPSWSREVDKNAQQSYYSSYSNRSVSPYDKFVTKGEDVIPNKEYLVADERQALADLYMKYTGRTVSDRCWNNTIRNYENVDAPMAWNYMDSSDRETVSQIGYKAKMRAAFVRYLHSDGNTREQDQQIKDACKDVFEEVPWMRSMNPGSYFQNLAYKPKLYELSAALTFRPDKMATLRTASPEKNYEAQEIIENTFDHVTHKYTYTVNKVFEVKPCDTVVKAYGRMAKDKDNEKEFMYHGTDWKGAVGIIRTGYKVFPASKAATGRMLGNGIYLAPVSSKSMQRLYLHDATGVILINDASFGKVASGGLAQTDKNVDTVEARSSRYGGTGSNSWVRNDEFCIKKAASVLPRLLVEVTTTG